MNPAHPSSTASVSKVCMEWKNLEVVSKCIGLDCTTSLLGLIRGAHVLRRISFGKCSFVFVCSRASAVHTLI